MVNISWVGICGAVPPGHSEAINRGTKWNSKFCRNLFNGTNLETFKFQNWIAEVNTLSRYGDNKYKVNLETPCSTIETKGKWTVLSENPIYSQLAKVEKGQAVFISGSYTVTKNSSTVDLNYFSIAW